MSNFLHKCAYFLIYGYTYLQHYFDKIMNWINPAVVSPITFKNEVEFGIFTEKKNHILCFDKPFPKICPPYTCCNYKFISIIVSIDNNGYNIHEPNYYIVNNKLNKYVITYFVNTQYNLQLDASIIKYKLTIIDQDVKIINLDEKQEILFNLNDYIIND
jgi:hypothetical protein